MEIEYQKYKWFYTSSGKLVVGGKSAEQNDELLKKIKSSHESFIIMHTHEPGSPFSVIIENPDKLKKSDLEETAVFTGCFSRAWKSGKKQCKIDIFSSNSLSKPLGLKTGTWVVKEKLDSMVVDLKLALTIQKGILRAVPLESLKGKSLLQVCPGKTDKEKMIPQLMIALNNKFKKDEILSALPAGGVGICK